MFENQTVENRIFDILPIIDSFNIFDWDVVVSVFELNNYKVNKTDLTLL